MSLPESRRAEYVRTTFDRIARRYDRLNRVISFRLDGYWRKKAVDAALGGGARRVLDMGTGTGDLALAAARRLSADGRVVGLDFSHPMLRLAAEKSPREKGGAKILYLQATALASPFKDGSFDAVMSGFVLRNVGSLEIFFREALRLLRPGGRLAMLDMFPPSSLPFSLLYSIYFYHFMPWVGALLARDREAYRYLSNSVRGFHSPETVGEIIADAGFADIRIEKFLSGAVCLHTAVKR